MTPVTDLTDCETLLDRGNSREAARRLKGLGPLDGPQATRREALWRRIRVDRQVLGVGLAVSLAVVFAVWASYS